MNRSVDREKLANLLGVSGWDHQDLSWMDQGLCRQTDPELFFPAESYTGGKDNGGKVGQAKRVCNGDPERGVAACPVVNLCREYAVMHPEEMDGVWGGTTKNERVPVRRERQEERRLVRAGLRRRLTDDDEILRERVLQEVRFGSTYRDITDRYSVGLGTISKWVQDAGGLEALAEVV